MTDREAIDVLKVIKAIWEEEQCEGEVEALQMAIDALEKQISNISPEPHRGVET